VQRLVKGTVGYDDELLEDYVDDQLPSWTKPLITGRSHV
jgi:hypothetical protein